MEYLQNDLKHTGDSQINFLAPPNLKPPLSVCLQRDKCNKKVHRGECVDSRHDAGLLRGKASVRPPSRGFAGFRSSDKVRLLAAPQPK